MGALVFVTFELSPFSAGGIGRVIHNQLKAMSAADRARSIVVLLDEKVDVAAFSACFPGARLVLADSNDEGGRHGGRVHHPPRWAYSNTPWHWKSAVAYRALKALADRETIDYVEFTDYTGVGFVSIQEKRLSGFLKDAILAVRLHSTRAIIAKHEASALSASDLNLIDLERKALRDCDLVVGQLAPVAEATREAFGFSTEEWAPRLHIQAPPVLLDTRGPVAASIVPAPDTPIVYGSKVQRFKRPDLFIRGVNIFCNAHPDVGCEVLLSAHSFDEAYRDSILKLIPAEHSARYNTDAPRDSAQREPLIAKSVFVAPSDFESFCLSAYEAALLGAVVVLNGANSAFGDGSPWIDGVNCFKFDGSPQSLAAALERAFARKAPLEMVRIPQDAPPWTAKLPARNVARDASAPLVSVIVPHYNLGGHLMATLESLLQQSYSNLEILVVDDRSPEAASKQLIDHLANVQRGNFRVIRAPANLGLAGARNLGIGEAKGKYVFPLDADDLIEPGFLAFAVEALENNPEFGVVAPQTAFFYEAENIPLRGEARDFHDYAIFVGEPLINGVCENRYSTATALIRTDLLRQHRYCESLRCYEDWNLYLRLAQAGVRFLVTTDVYFHYRSRPNSMVTADRDPEQKALFMHDMLRNGMDVKALPPLGYFAFLTRPKPVETVRETVREVEREVVRIQEVVNEIWPLPLDRADFKKMFIKAGRRERRVNRIKYYLCYPHARLREHYQANVQRWRSLIRAVRDMPTS